MAMEISKTFVVKASRGAAWSFLTEPRRVARCLPGAAVTSQIDERTHAGTISIKVGPVAATYKGTLRFERLDPEAGTAELVASGHDVRGKGGADMRMSSRLIERGPRETEIVVTSQVNVVGVLAQFGRGMIQDVSDQLFQKFADCARAELETAHAETPTSQGSVAAGEMDREAAMRGTARDAAATIDRDAPTSGDRGELGAGPAVAGPAAAPLDVMSLGSVVVGRAAVRMLRRPVFWVGALVLLLVLYWALRP